MNEVERLLIETPTSLADIAIGTGFYDQSHFARKFKAWKGIAPGKYRKHLSDQREPLS